jgi:predicted metal-dependent hydrolase
LSVPPEPALDEPERALFERGLEEFNTGLYFECHETLEDLWTGVRGPARDFFQGLIQLAVAFYHLTRGTEAGARSLLGRALTRLARYPDRYGSVELEVLRADARELRARLETGGVSDADLASLPRCRRTAVL